MYEAALASFLGVSEDGHQAEAALAGSSAAAAGAQAAKIAAEIGKAAPPSAATIEVILGRVRARQQAVGYTGDVKSWIEKVTPLDFA